MSQTDLGSDGTQTEGILEDSCIPGGRLSRPACAKVLGAAHEGVAVGDLGLSPCWAPSRELVRWAGHMLLAFQETSLTVPAVHQLCTFLFPVEIWRNHLEAYTRRALELEESLEASTSQMMNLNL